MPVQMVLRLRSADHMALNQRSRIGVASGLFLVAKPTAPDVRWAHGLICRNLHRLRRRLLAPLKTACNRRVRWTPRPCASSRAERPRAGAQPVVTDDEVGIGVLRQQTLRSRLSGRNTGVLA